MQAGGGQIVGRMTIHDTVCCDDKLLTERA
jgi:hypothetical protein